MTATAAFLAYVAPAFALSGDCERLRRAIADSGRGTQNSQYQAAADRQRAEIARTQAYAHQIGCDNRKFLFFGSDPPAQCGQIQSQIGRMRDNLQDLQARSGGQGASAELVARFNAQCAGDAPRPPNLVEALFGQPKPGEVEQQPLEPDAGAKPDTGSKQDSEPRSTSDAIAGGKAVCVRTCDGAFFPLSYSANSERLTSLADSCRALCPNAEVTLYTYPVSGEIEQAVSVNGAKYMDSPTALRYRHVFDPSCSCRRKGQTWADALGPAESLLGRQAASDILVTPAKAAELSRPRTDAKPDSKTKSKTVKTAADATDAKAAGDRGRTDANGIDTVLRDAAEALNKDGSGIASNADGAKSTPLREGLGKTLDQKDASGATHRIRVVGD